MRWLSISTPFIALLLAWDSPARADWDFQYGIMGRSYTLGAVTQANIGHGFLLWGENPLPHLPKVGPRQDGGPPIWKYGYLRPAIYAQSAGVMNRLTAELEFFPISIFGIALGQGIHQRPQFSRQWDCDNAISCKGWLARTTLRAQMVLGAAGFFAAGVLRKEWISATDNSRPFGDEGMGITGKPGGDRFLTATAVLGYQLRPNWSLGTQMIRCSAELMPNRSVTSLVFVNHLRGDTSYVLGVGTYLNDYVPIGFTVATLINVNVQRALGFL